jgi:hypothetical protein
VQLLEETAVELEQWIALYGDGVPVTVTAASNVDCMIEVSGLNPFDFARNLYRVGLVDGPKVLERFGTCCTECRCTNLKVQFTLTSELPWIFSDVEFCAEDESFPLVEFFCPDFSKLCDDCSQVGTKLVPIEVPRPECRVIIRYDGTWCAEGWDPPSQGVPPADCILVVEAEEFEPPETEETCTSQSIDDEACQVAIFNDGTWGAINWNPLVDGCPPEFCNLEIINLDNECEDPDTEDVCLVRLFYDFATGAATWEPIRWSGVAPDPACDCYEIAEICCTPDPNDLPPADPCPPTSTVDCEVTLNADGTYNKLNWSWVPSDGNFPPAQCNFVVPGQDTSPLTEFIEVAADEFIPDCGPFPIQPPPPFNIVDACYCEPWCATRLCCTFENEKIWNDATTYIELYAGSSDLRNTKIQAFQNPFFNQGQECPCDPNDSFWDCREACSTIEIPQLPSGSRLIVDARTRIVELILKGGRRISGLRFITSANGLPFEWMDLANCAALCVVVSTDCLTVASDATVTVGLAERYLASGW